jgi:hypothetical protein
VRRKLGGDGLREEMAGSLRAVLHMLGIAERLSAETGGPPEHVTARRANAERRLRLIESGQAFYCPAANLPPEARERYDPDEYVIVGEDGRIEPYGGRVVKRTADSSAEPPRPPMRATANASSAGHQPSRLGSISSCGLLVLFDRLISTPNFASRDSR